MSRILITGITGFTGRYLAQELVYHGHEVVGIAHTNNNYSLPWPVYNCDLNDPQKLLNIIKDIKPERIAHLAAISFVAEKNIELMYHTNVIGTRNLLQALASLSDTISSVLIASSANVYGNAKIIPTDEGAPLCPINDYAISKLAMEHISRLWKEQLPITIVRPFNYTGVGQGAHFLIPKIVKHFKDQSPVLELGNLDVERDFSDVRTIAAVYRRILEGSYSGFTFNICSEHVYSLQDILSIMNDLTGYSPKIITESKLVRTHEIKKLAGTNKFLKETLGTINSIPIKKTLEWMYDS